MTLCHVLSSPNIYEKTLREKDNIGVSWCPEVRCPWLGSNVNNPPSSARIFRRCWADSISHRGSWHRKWRLFSCWILFHLFHFALASFTAFVQGYTPPSITRGMHVLNFFILGKRECTDQHFVIICFQISHAIQFLWSLGRSSPGYYLWAGSLD